MADVHFVVGPPGGTQRLPGHKVSNSYLLGSVPGVTEDPPSGSRELGVGTRVAGADSARPPRTQKAGPSPKTGA